MIFNIKGNTYRLVVQVSYRNGLVVIDWIGNTARRSSDKSYRASGKQGQEVSMNVQVIRSSKDYAQAMARLTALMALDPAAGSEDDNELELLALVIEDYERKTVPPISPRSRRGHSVPPQPGGIGPQGPDPVDRLGVQGVRYKGAVHRAAGD